MDNIYYIMMYHFISLDRVKTAPKTVYHPLKVSKVLDWVFDGDKILHVFNLASLAGFTLI